MILNLLPSALFLAVVAMFIRFNRGRLFIQVYLAIVASYLNIFPALDYFFSGGVGTENFAHIQLVLILAFEMPLLAIIGSCKLLQHVPKGPAIHRPARLSPFLPLACIAALAVFWYVALGYDLLRRRIGFEALQEATAQVPAVLLYIHRGVVETSFFVAALLLVALKATDRTVNGYYLYRLAFAAYLVSFVIFFALNSRMQFIVFVLCLACVHPGAREYMRRPWRVVRLFILIGIAVVLMTLARELFLEKNERLDAGQTGELLAAAGWLISERLDSTLILNRVLESGFSLFGVQLAGVARAAELYLAFVFDPQRYDAIKESLITSPSVAIVHALLNFSHVDFPKSMVLDLFLSFGITGLIGAALVLGVAVRFVDAKTRNITMLSPSAVLALYTMPLLLEFEKEFMGFAAQFMKWLPVYVVIYALRPTLRQRGRAMKGEGAAEMGPGLGNGSRISA